MPYAEVEPAEVKARLARGEDVFLLDVREPDEVEAWAYPSASTSRSASSATGSTSCHGTPPSWWPATWAADRPPRPRR